MRQCTQQSVLTWIVMLVVRLTTGVIQYYRYLGIVRNSVRGLVYSYRKTFLCWITTDCPHSRLLSSFFRDVPLQNVSEHLLFYYLHSKIQPRMRPEATLGDRLICSTTKERIFYSQNTVYILDMGALVNSYIWKAKYLPLKKTSWVELPPISIAPTIVFPETGLQVRTIFFSDIKSTTVSHTL